MSLITHCDLTQASITPLQLSNLKESNGKKLIMTRPKFREYFRKKIYTTLHKNKIVKEKGHHIEDVIFNDGLNRDMVEELIETCLRIFVEKQKGLIWDLKKKWLKGKSIVSITSEKEECNYIYLFDVDYKKIFTWISPKTSWKKWKFICSKINFLIIYFPKITFIQVSTTFFIFIILKKTSIIISKRYCRSCTIFKFP